MNIENRLRELGLYLPEPAKVPPDVVLYFAWVRTFGNRVYVSGHGPQAPDGSVVGPFGRVGSEVTPEQAAAIGAFGSALIWRRTACGGTCTFVLHRQPSIQLENMRLFIGKPFGCQH